MTWFPGGDARIVCYAVSRRLEEDLEESVLETIDHHWNGLVRNGAVDDQTILRCQTIDFRDGVVHVNCQPCAYRLFAVGRTHPELGLRVDPVAVSGIVSVGTGTDERFLIGRRPAGVTQFPGKLELVASGGLSPEDIGATGEVDVMGCLIKELSEELDYTITRSVISGWRMLGVMYADDVVDIVVRMRLSAEPARTSRAVSRADGDRYDDIDVVSLSSISAFTAKHHEELVPTSVALLDLVVGGGGDLPETLS
jgi:8-oxo-dGTP pyrophosphatase MutT (NUDIX family)